MDGNDFERENLLLERIKNLFDIHIVEMINEIIDGTISHIKTIYKSNEETLGQLKTVFEKHGDEYKEKDRSSFEFGLGKLIISDKLEPTKSKVITFEEYFEKLIDKNMLLDTKIKNLFFQIIDSRMDILSRDMGVAFKTFLFEDKEKANHLAKTTKHHLIRNREMVKYMFTNGLEEVMCASYSSQKQELPKSNIISFEKFLEKRESRSKRKGHFKRGRY